MLSFDETKPIDEFAQFAYRMRLKKYAKPEDIEIPQEYEAISNNLDIQLQKAESNFYNCDYDGCLEITNRIITEDPYNEACLPVHISTLVETGKQNDLFRLAHDLIDLFPDWSVAWFGVGSYYYLIGKQDLARRYLSKATQLDRVFGPAWLIYGHSFAQENEHDQAMAAYFKACQLLRG